MDKEFEAQQAKNLSDALRTAGKWEGSMVSLGSDPDADEWEMLKQVSFDTMARINLLTGGKFSVTLSLRFEQGELSREKSITVRPEN